MWKLWASDPLNDFVNSGNYRGVPPYKVGAPCAMCPNACENNLCSKLHDILCAKTCPIVRWPHTHSNWVIVISLYTIYLCSLYILYMCKHTVYILHIWCICHIWMHISYYTNRPFGNCKLTWLSCFITANPCPYMNKYPNCAALKAKGGCDNIWVSDNCAPLCKCHSEIIPIAWKLETHKRS